MTRRDSMRLGLAASVCLPAWGASDGSRGDVNLHEQLLALAKEQEASRRARFAAVKSGADLEVLQKSLRSSFLDLIGGLPGSAGPPPIRKVGVIEADGYRIEKLVFESFPGYFVSALLYRPTTLKSPAPGIISPCGHSTVGKAEPTYQILHANLARRGFVVLTYDPVGQGERSQFWDADRGRSRFKLSCGEHAVLGNPLYLLGTSLARYRIWDGIRAIDHLASLPEVDAQGIGCVGNSGGGNLTAYITALEPRVAAAAICCYITTLPRRMRNRIQEDPSADPEQDIHGFVSQGIDHAGLLALAAPRPTLLGTAKFDFFPIEGARETFEEARRLYEIAGTPDRIHRVEAAARHGLGLPLRQAVYEWFGRWLMGGEDPAGKAEEQAVPTRPARELLVCPEGQVNRTYHSRPLLPMALEHFETATNRKGRSLRDVLGLDNSHADPAISEVSQTDHASGTLILCINGNETGDWREQPAFLDEMKQHGHTIAIIDPRGVGKRRCSLEVKGHDYNDPISGVEENIAYNAFLVGKSLPGLRVADILAAISRLSAGRKWRKLVLCGRRDAAWTASLAAAVEPSITGVAAEEMLLDFRRLFTAEGRPINASWLVPGLLRDVGDVADVLARIAPRKILLASSAGELSRPVPSARVQAQRFSTDPRRLTDWMQG